MILVLPGKEKSVSYLQVEKDNSDRLISDYPDPQSKISETCYDILSLQKNLEKTLNVLHSALEDSIKIIARMVEIRDPYTAGHQKRVAYLGKEIAGEMGFPAETMELIQQAALVHDIGKLYIPTEILNKIGGLTPAEFERIKLHPQIGYAILNKGGFFQQVDQIVWQHHERLNGSGYPRGLCREQIRLEARILSVADVIDAMAVARPYRPALGVCTALNEIAMNSSILYDEQVVNAALKFFAGKGFGPQESPLYAG
jgi:putative nucleotidyltransferase with HDIG domain